MDRAIPVSVAASAASLIIFGMVVSAVFCNVVSFVKIPAVIDMIVSRIRGLMVLLASVCVLCLIRGCPVSVSKMIRVLYEADRVVAINVMINVHELV